MQVRLRLDQLRLFIGERDFGPAHIQFADRPGAESLPLRFQLLFQDPDGFLSDANLLAIEEKLVKGEAHFHRDAIDHGGELRFGLGKVELRDRDPARGGAAGVERFDDADIGVVILRTQRGGPLPLAPGDSPARDDRRQITGARLDQTAAGRLHFFLGDGDIRVVGPGDVDRLLDLVMRSRDQCVEIR